MSQTSEAESTKAPKPKKKRGFLSFGLKTFLILFCLSAIGINYWRHSVNQHQALKVLKNCGAEFIYEHEMTDDFDYLADPWNRIDGDSSIRKSLRSVLGSSMVDRVACVRMIEKSNFAPIRPRSGKRKYHQSEAWIALRTLNQINPLKAVAVEANSEEQLEILSSFFQLRYLQLVSYKKNNLEVLARLPNLESFEFATRSSDIDWIADLQKVKTLHVRKVLPAPRLTIDVSFLSAMPKLEQLEFRALQLRSVEAIGSLENLKQLGLIHTDVESVASVASPNIEVLHLTNSAIQDAGAILEMDSLKQVDLTGTLLQQAQVDELMSAARKNVGFVQTMPEGRPIED